MITPGKIGGQARAMVVSSGIERAIDYLHAFRAYLQERKSPCHASTGRIRKSTIVLCSISTTTRRHQLCVSGLLPHNPACRGDLKAALDGSQVYSPEQVRKLVELFLTGAERDKLDPIPTRGPNGKGRQSF